MKLIFSALIAFCFLISCGPGKKPLKGETAFQRELNAEFKDASKSPLKKKDLKTFEGLDFFKFDSTYVVKAHLERTPNSEWFNMKTTTSRVSKERIFGVLHFELKGIPYQLNIYQGADTMQEEGMEDYLFLPFLDETNGTETYGGGRYIDLRIPDGHTLELDFNTAYNPFCAYNEAYSCPIVPRVNYLKTRVEAGVKAFEGH
ncbi:DUF1684 domain-containing protein [Flavobacteriaceae bacterium XHP0103]|uniref:DUF1684 domain-containing protein n=1 Tax=Marixanthotalea marina TaxID=2844359 RepID=UPI00298A07F2|nr:DUF1684 domain-containing protein [Marixanthotalea marina]MBU3822449.1 DUF1684 domain-containing protein [Marixanthotalea marina]